jgi:hypothetical protein
MGQVLEQGIVGSAEPDLERIAVIHAGVLPHRCECLVGGGKRGVDAFVLGLHVGEHLEVLRRPGALGVPLQQRPQLGVLGGVVVMKRVGHLPPPPLQRGPDGVLGDRRVLGRGEEVGEVATEGMVHEVHPGLVVGTFGGVRLAGQRQLGALQPRTGCRVLGHGVSLDGWSCDERRRRLLGPTPARLGPGAHVLTNTVGPCGCACSGRAR